MNEELEPKKDKKKDKADKVRSAWISFVGRILAQLVGAIATVTLGVMVLHRSMNGPPTSPASGQVAVTVIFVSPSSTPSTIDTDSATPRPEIAARQVEMARAIAQAVSGTLRSRE